MEDGYLLNNVHKIRHIPTVIVQGRYDLVCPMRTAWDLKKAFPEADLQIIADAGHSAKEAGTTAALVRATDAIRDRFKVRARQQLEHYPCTYQFISLFSPACLWYSGLFAW